MGRAYDRNPGAVTPTRLVNMCRHFLGVFSRERLRERVFKRLSGSEAARQADAYVEGYRDIRASDFDGVERDLQGARKLYKEKAEMLRHAQAHSPEHLLVARGSWEIDWDDVQKLLEVPLAVALGIQQSFLNGLPVALGKIDREVERHCVDQARRIVLGL